MTKRIYNFSSGPAVMPMAVLEEAREAMLSLGDSASAFSSIRIAARRS